MMDINAKKIGVIVEVNGDVSKVGVYSLSNDLNIIWYGEYLTGPKLGAYVTVNQNDIKIIASISSEKVIDQQNTVKSEEFDNRYHKNSVNRIIELKIKGVIEKGKFQVTSKYVPMIGNEVSLTTKSELNLIYGVQNNEDTICIGRSLLEDYPIQIPINSFFASHIGIFGNTGSGKSNTLHKLFLELFRSKYRNEIISKSQFFVIDFNGEYVADDLFGIEKSNKKIYKINTRNPCLGNKLQINKEYIFDADILAILFDARSATQVPFLKSAIKTFNGINDGAGFANLEVKFLEKIIIKYKSVSGNSLFDWIATSKKLGVLETLFEEGLESIFVHNEYGNMEMKSEYGNMEMKSEYGNYIMKDENITVHGRDYLKLDSIQKELEDCYSKLTPIRQLGIFLEFQKIFVTAWRTVSPEHIGPLFKRIETATEDLEKVIEIKDETESECKVFNVISLVNANASMSRLIPMLFSKMIYDEQKKHASNESVNRTRHLIIDEAHNILNDVSRRNGDDWQDYRLSVFEEIIKEGRKFGFYLTLSSQRPADISPTVLSQVHNYLIHRLVNENDLRMLLGTMPTLDKASYNMIPILGQGEAIITGKAVNVPALIKIDKEKEIRPSSDDIELTKFWLNN